MASESSPRHTKLRPPGGPASNSVGAAGSAPFPASNAPRNHPVHGLDDREEDGAAADIVAAAFAPAAAAALAAAAAALCMAFDSSMSSSVCNTSIGSRPVADSNAMQRRVS